MKNTIILSLAILMSLGLFAQNNATPASDYDQAKHDQKMTWWRDAKFGLFVHWGPYCLYGAEYNGFHQAASGSEWGMNRLKIPVMEYRAKASTFKPDQYDPESWIKLAKDAGMQYIVFTTKHHDGFSMYRSDASPFNIVNFTHFGRDVVDELVNACRRHDMKLGFYYSQSQDWCHPGGATHFRKFEDGWPNPDSVYIKDFVRRNSGAWDYIQKSKTFDEYFAEIALPQIKELLSRYGNDICVMFFDTPGGISSKQAAEVFAEMEKYPHIIMNNRLRYRNYPGDYGTPEGLVPKREDVEGVDWETCMTIGTSWGYKPWDTDWKSPETLIRNLIRIASRGGNFLLNVGPDPQGLVRPEEAGRLRAMGSWMGVNGEAIHGTRGGPLTPEWGECTRKDAGNRTTLYLFVFDWPADGKLVLDADYRIKGATMLHNGQKLDARRSDGKIVIDLPQLMPDPTASVVKLELNEKLPPVQQISNTQKYLRSLKKS